MKGNLYITDNRLSVNEMWCVADNHNYMEEGKSRNRWTFLKIENLTFLQNYDD